MDRKLIIIVFIVLAAAALFLSLQKSQPMPEQSLPDNIMPLSDVKVESICTDKIDNDDDGLVDNQDGDCWIKEGVIYETQPYYYPNHSFREITEQIPQLDELGIKIIYLMPFWEQPPGEGRPSLIYHTYDYYKIDQAYGTPQELKELIDTAHKYGMKVLFDLVTCCTWEGSEVWNNGGIFSMPLSELNTKAEKLGWNLEYQVIDGNKYVYYNCTNSSKISCVFGGMIAGSEVVALQYPRAGWGFAVDKTNPEIIRYFTGVAEYYVKEYDIDGWRLDAPIDNWNSDIISGNHSIQRLLKSAKEAIIKVKPNAIFLSEGPSVSRNPLDHLNNPELDKIAETSYSYYFYQKLNEIARKGKLFDILSEEKTWYGRTRVRFSESHDTYQRINDIAPELNMPLAVLLFTIPATPMIQAGQEVGATEEFFTKPRVDWKNGNYSLREFYKRVISIRNSNNALKYGNIENVWKSGDNIYAYSRIYGNETVTVIINFNSKESTSILNIAFNAGTALKDELSDDVFTVSNPSDFKITVPAYGSRILVIKK